MQRRNTQSTQASSAKRGQTTLDFAVGMGVFLLSFAFVVGFIPTLFTPLFSPIDPGDNLAAESASDVLVSGVIGTESGDGGNTALDRECTKAFFAGENDENADIYNENYDCDRENKELITGLGLINTDTAQETNEPPQNVQVTLYENDGVGWTEYVEDENGDELEFERNSGSDSTDSGQSTSRIVSFENEDGEKDLYRLVVTVW